MFKNMYLILATLNLLIIYFVNWVPFCKIRLFKYYEFKTKMYAKLFTFVYIILGTLNYLSIKYLNTKIWLTL